MFCSGWSNTSYRYGLVMSQADTKSATYTPILHVQASFTSAERRSRQRILSQTSLKCYTQFSSFLSLWFSFTNTQKACSFLGSALLSGLASAAIFSLAVVLLLAEEWLIWFSFPDVLLFSFPDMLSWFSVCGFAVACECNYQLGWFWHCLMIMLNSKEWLICSKLLELFLRLVLWK